MKRPHSKGSWFILVKIALNQTCKITLKIIFNKKISKKDYCSKRCIWCLFFPLYQKRPPLVLVEKRWEPGIEMRFRRESSRVFRKNAPCVFFFLPAFWILLTSLIKVKYCILDMREREWEREREREREHACGVPGTVLSTWHTLPHLILTVTSEVCY